MTEPELPVDAGVLLFPLTIERRAIVCELEVDGDPVPWARAGRSARGRAYTPARQRDWAEHVGWAIRQAYTGPPLEVELGVWLTFRRQTRRHADVDNLCKAVLDAGTGIAWADDAAITLLLARVLVDPDAPGLELVVYRRQLEVDTLEAPAGL